MATGKEPRMKIDPLHSVTLDEVNYKNGAKNHWRRNIWNRIVERLAVPARDAVVLYLAGASDLDRSVALSKGFRDANLIAVDRDMSKVSFLRRRGNLCLKGDFFDVVRSVSIPVHVIHADMCGGLSNNMRDHVALWACLPNTKNAVVCANMCRGHDAQSNEWRNFLRANNPDRNDADFKHRGKLLHTHSLMIAALMLADAIKVENGKLAFSPKPGFEDVQKLIYENACVQYEHVTQAWTHSYRSGNLYFDSVVYVLPHRNDEFDGDWHKSAQKLLGISSLARNVAAILAHRTRRLQGGR